MRFFFSATFVVMLTLGATEAMAQEGDAARARELFLSGVDAFDEEHLDDALGLFLESYEIRPSQSVLFNIAVTERRLGHDEDALMHFYEWVRINAGDAGPRLTEAFSAIDDLVPGLATLRVDSSPSNVTVFVDGARAQTTGSGILVLRGGTYTLRFEADGYEPSERQVTVEAGNDETIQVSLEEAAADVAPPEAPIATDDQGGGLLFTWVGVGLTVAFAGLAVGSWVAGEAAYQDLVDTCAPSCSADQVSTVETWDTLTTVGLVGVGVMAAATVVIALVELDVFGGSDDSHAVSVGPTGASYRYRF